MSQLSELVWRYGQHFRQLEAYAPGTRDLINASTPHPRNFRSFRTDAVAPLAAGAVAPTSADRLRQTVPEFGLQFGLLQVVGFTVDVAPGSTSNALIISTDATAFTIGNGVLYVVSDGSVLTATFEPITYGSRQTAS